MNEEASTIRALVIEDEIPLRTLTVRALQEEGFRCDVAADGIEARTLLLRNEYDVVVTDLKMPRMHGHALIVELLQRSDSPMIVVLTAVIDSRLVRDLIARGVEDIVFKPTDMSVFAAKVVALWDRRRRMGPLGTAAEARREIEGLKDLVDPDGESD